MLELLKAAFTALILCSLLVLLPAFGHAGDDTDINEILGGFEDNTLSADKSGQDINSSDNVENILDGFDDAFTEEPTEDAGEHVSPETMEKLTFLSLDGYCKLSSSYNFAHNPPSYNQTDWRGLSRLRSELQLKLNIDLPHQWQTVVSGKGFYDFAYRINGQDDYTDDVIDDYESELEFREVYLQGSLTKNLDIKFGRQIVVWGKSDNIRVTDVINPLDLREPGMTDIEDLRLPVTMTRMDYYVGDFNISAMAIHEIRFNKTPVFGSDFYPLPFKAPPEKKPDSTLENTEYALAVNGIFSGWDFSACFADIYNDESRFESVYGYTLPAVQMSHDRLQMIGASSNVALGNWLLKGEIAWLHGLEFTRTPDDTFDRLDVLAGVEYSGFSEATICLEAVNRHLIDYTSDISRFPDLAEEDEFQSVLRYTKTFANDTVTLTILASLFGLTGDDGSFERYTVEYDVNDALSVLLGLVTYQSGDLPEMKNIGENDRILAEIKYSF